MPIRVHELAKEFKISTAALKKHLSDMGVVVKSHMSPVDDDIVDKIRAKFNEEVAAVKQRQRDITDYHKKIVLAEKKKEEEREEKVKQELEEARLKKEREEIPVFVEKKIRKAVEKPVPAADEIELESRTTSRKLPPEPPVPPPPDQVDESIDKRLKAEKKIKDKEHVEQNKHLKAVLQHLKKSSRKKKVLPTELEEAEISRSIKRTLSTSVKKKRYKKDDKKEDEKDTKIIISEFTSVSELAKMMDVSATEIIAKFFKMGQMVTINQRLDKDSLEMICHEFEFDVEFEEEYGKEILESQAEEIAATNRIKRPPVVTVMGHVDHGKTAILDRIRSTNVIAGEAGGITQHIGAYQVAHNDEKITFLDTPGHEAFTAMRARGANITDIAIIVVAANEGVKKQTIEAIDHAKAAGVPIIVAINKIDLKDANVDRTINDLMKQNLMLEGYGGEILWVKCSALTGEGINELLDTILLAAEMMEIKAAAHTPGKGIVIESRKDQRMGTLVTVLIKDGELKKSDSVICGATYGRIRKIEDERGNERDMLLPSDVGILYGINEVPKAGDFVDKVDNEKIARQISAERMHIRKEREKFQSKTSLDNLFQKIKEHEMAELRLIVKGDTDGSVEALCDSLQKLSNNEVLVNIISHAVGGINEADVSLATASDAVVIGFHIRANSAARKLAEEENVEIKLYQVIYEVIEDIEKAIQGMLAPEMEERFLGSATVKQIFKIKKVGTVAGCFVEKGNMTSSGKIRIYRNDIQIHEGKISSLRHYAEEVKEVKAGSDCGIAITDFNDLKENDIIENFEIVELERKLRP
ncbi:MAG: translation initiation factor IF-2 [Candidatus Cloacimonetes bacterium]|nr:translation initiation factor IF-2 [Candidatus Cloacimonadota bacterium]